MAKKILSIALALVMALSVFAVAASAGNVGVLTQSTFASAIEAASKGDTLILLEDVEFDAYVEVTGDDLTIDLAGKDITFTSNTGFDVYGTVTFIDSIGTGSVTANTTAVWVNANSTVTIEDGTFNGAVKALGENAAIIINDGTFTAGSNDDVVEGFSGGQVTINDGTFTGDLYFKAHGDLTINDGSFTSGTNIWGHGNDTVGSDVTINGGTFVATSVDGANIYKPGAGTLTINGGTFTGSSNVYTKCGATIINNGTFTATREKVAFVHNGSGFEPTGDCIMIETCGYPSGTPTLKVYGGTFTSAHGDMIGAYEWGGYTFADTYFVEGTAVQGDVPASVVSKYVKNTTKVVEYATLAEAVEALSDGDTLALIQDVAINDYQEIEADNVTIDLAGHKIISKGNTALDLYGSFTIVDTVGGGYIKAGYRAIWVNPDAEVELDGAHLYGVVSEGDFTMTSGKVTGDIWGMNGADVVIEDGRINGSALVIKDGTSLTINGGTFVAGPYCVASNGSRGNEGIEITINGGSFTAKDADGAAIYMQQAGTLTINGGEFVGADALYIKSGDVVINGGTFRATAAKADYSYYGNGFNVTGDTIVVDSCGYPGGDPSLTINDGRFYSKYADIIGYYVYGDNDLDSTAFVYGGNFGDKAVPAQFWATNATAAFERLTVKNGTAAYDEEHDVIVITADEGATKVEVLRTVNGSANYATFTDLTGGAQLSQYNQVFAREPGTFNVTIDGTTYAAQIVFPVANAADLIVVDGATVAVSGSTITLTATAAQPKVSVRTTANTYVTASNPTGGARISSAGTLYATRNGSATLVIPNSGTYTVNFVFGSAAANLAANLKVTNGTATVEGTTITLTPTDETKQVNLAYALLDKTPISFSNPTGFATITTSGTLYAKNSGSATALIDGTEYTVNFVFATKSPVELLKVTNGTASVTGSVITLTATDSNKQITIGTLLSDGSSMTIRSNGTATLSKSGKLYAKKTAYAFVTIAGTDYTVLFAGF